MLVPKGFYYYTSCVCAYPLLCSKDLERTNQELVCELRARDVAPCLFYELQYSYSTQEARIAGI